MATETLDHPTLTAVVAAFEERLADGDFADWQSYLPSAGHKDFKRFALEMILVDIHHRWKRGQPKSLADYLNDLPPEFSTDVAFRQAVALEECRCRKAAGELIEPADLMDRYGLPRDIESSGRTATRNHVVSKRLAEELDAILAKSPEPFGFRVLEPLGRGELSRVFLAEQAQVGGRRIVVKVGVGRPQEIEALGRLNHENIVPLYWAQDLPPYYMLCMPFFGRTTLQKFLRSIGDDRDRQNASVFWEHLGGRVGYQSASRSTPSFEDASLWVASRLAKGLSHAHSHGVIHGDVKPANILLASNGEPMLLDFNLSAVEERPLIGGTAPYMSPEQVQSMLRDDNAIDNRSDVFSLGIVLYELAMGRRPFPDRSLVLRQSVERMLEDRRALPDWGSSTVSPAFRAIVETCLAFDKDRRYPTCESLVEDVERHLTDRPLRVARNRSWTELSRKQANRTVGWLARPRNLKLLLAGASVLAVGTGAAVYQFLASHAQQQRADFRKEVEALRFRFGIQDGNVERMLEDFRDAERLDKMRSFSRGWTERQPMFWLGCGEGEKYDLLTAALQIESLAAHAIKPMREGLDSFAARQGLISDDVEVLRRASERYQESPTLETSGQSLPSKANQLILAVKRMEEGRLDLAKTILDELTVNDPDNFWAWFWSFRCDAARGQHERAYLDVQTCMALRPDFKDLLLLRARAALQVKRLDVAVQDASALIGMGRRVGEAYLLRGVAKIKKESYQDALSDLEAAVDFGLDRPKTHLLMAAAAQGFKDYLRSEIELGKVETSTAASPADWTAKLYVRIKSPKAMESEIDEAIERAMELDPSNPQTLWLKAIVLVKRRNDARSAAPILDALSQKWAEDPLSLLRCEASIVGGGRTPDLMTRAEAIEACVRIAKRADDPHLLLWAAANVSRFKPQVDETAAVDAAVNAIAKARMLQFMPVQVLDDRQFDGIRRHPAFEGLKRLGRTDGPPLRLSGASDHVASAARSQAGL
jgi:serine/threonine protein kinase/tetratricopeptide (TPR) repeat protein